MPNKQQLNNKISNSTTNSNIDNDDMLSLKAENIINKQTHIINLSIKDIYNGCSKIITITIKKKCSCIKRKNKILRMVKCCELCNNSDFVITVNKKEIIIPPLFDINTITELEEGDIIKYRIIENGTLTVNNENDLLLVHHIYIQDAFSDINLYFTQSNDFMDNYHFTYDAVVKDQEVLFVDGLGLPNKNGEFGKLMIKFFYIYPKKTVKGTDFFNFMKNKTNMINKNVVYKTFKLQSCEENGLDVQNLKYINFYAD